MNHPTDHPADVPAWPAYTLTVHADGRVDAAGPLVPPATYPHRGAAVGTVAGASARLGRPVRATATEADGTTWHLVVAPDGSVGELPAERAPARRRGTRAAARAPGPTTTTAPGAATGPEAATGPRDGDEPAIADGLARVAEHLEAGRIDRAAELAARLDRRASGTLGVSHPDALRIREVLARISALLGDPAAGARLFRDVAERWHYRGDHEDAESAAARAVALWLQITDLDTALATGTSMVRLRNQIPGADGAALTEVLTHRSRLESARPAPPSAGPGTAGAVSAAGPAVVAGPGGGPAGSAPAGVPAGADTGNSGAGAPAWLDAARAADVLPVRQDPADGGPAPGPRTPAARPAFSWDRPARDGRTGG
ncbi:hypothetical protein [Streptomyces sp. NPDC101249]|uniref:hypothetical protein n=1 Tax=Streptomyces sp. NPDC101249 TaxID=3366140 RepID=UPI003827A0F9